jgi:putative transcriptional regulator
VIHHHLSRATLAAYATGALPEALSLVAATHIHHCEACCQQVRTAEGSGGALIEAQVPATLSEDALERMLARLDEPVAPPPPVLNPDLPPPLNRVRFGRSRPIGFGFRWRPLYTTGSAWGGLLLVQPGRTLPRHGHVGLELTYVLRGTFSDSARIFEAGDIAEQLGEHPAPLRVVSPQACLCLLATRGLRLRGWLGRVQRMLHQPRDTTGPE